MSSAVEQIKARLNIVDVVSSYLKLEKAGSSFKARCPFHNERTPSFFVSPARESYYCFGCNKGGDLISFVENIEGVDFLAALKMLADRAGVKLDQYQPAADKQKEKLYEILLAAKTFYASELKKRPAALAYLKKRGLGDETIAAFELGFAPEDWQALYNLLLKRGYPVSLMEQAGLVALSAKSAQGHHYYDRFRNRIMFPLNDALGRAVGFSGRIFDAGSREQEAAPAKYINSPQTILYDKSRLLFGYDQAKIAIRREDYAVLVEGQFDLLMSHQAGMTNTVAISGTALTADHLALLRRLSANVVMAFDGDWAGVEAARRAIELTLSTGLELKIAVLPPDTDPADFAAAAPEKWRELCQKAEHVINFSLSALVRKHQDQRALAKAIRQEVYPFIVKLASKLDQAHFVGKIAGLVGLNEEVIRADLNDFARAAKGETVQPRPGAPVDARPRREKLESRLFGFFFWLQTLAERPVWFGEFEKQLKESLAADFQNREQHWSAKKNEMALETELSFAGSDPKKLKEAGEELLLYFVKETLKEDLQALMEKLAAAEKGKDEPAIAKYLKECQDISRRLNNLGHQLL